MGSLYEPSVRSSTWSVTSRRFSKRFTTLSGWREIGMGVYAMGNSNFRMFSAQHQFDPEHLREDGFEFTTPEDAPPLPSGHSFVEYRRSSEGTIGKAIGSVHDAKRIAIGQVHWQRAHEVGKYHLFTRKEKWAVIAMAGVAGIFPALTFNIYLPASTRIAKDFQVSIEAVNLTITSFLIAQGIAPLCWAPLIDAVGRRAVYIYSFLLYIISSVVLSFSPNFPILAVFRTMQSIGIASTVSIGCAIIQDIAPPSERNDFYRFYRGIRNATLVMAPIIGGLMSAWINFRCMFVLLFGLSLATLTAILFFLPETQRDIAGNGSKPLSGIHLPLIWRCRIFGKPAHMDESLEPGRRSKLSSTIFVQPMRLLKEKDILLSLIFSSFVFAIWMMVTVSTAALFQPTFGLKAPLLGLTFVPNAVGTIMGSTLIGNLLNQDFIKACSVYRKAHSLPPSINISRHAIPADFPLEHTRLIRLPGLTVLLIITLSFYGFTLQYPSLTSLGGWISIPLLLQFLIAVMTHAICGIHQTLISDQWPSRDVAASTASNLMRCTLAGVGVAVIQKLLECVEVGPTFLALALVVMVLVPLPIIEWFWGGVWRQARDAKLSSSGPALQAEKV